MSAVLEGPATIAGIYLGVKSIQSLFAWCEAQKAAHGRKAFDLYVETGTKNTAFHHLSSRAVKAAERQRKLRIAKEAQQNSAFTAYTKCPKCYTFDIHSISKTILAGCKRECNNCSYAWRQR